MQYTDPLHYFCVKNDTKGSPLVTEGFFFFLAQQPTRGQGLMIHDVSRSHTTTEHSE